MSTTFSSINGVYQEPVIFIDFLDIGFRVASRAIDLIRNSGTGTFDYHNITDSSAKFITWGVKVGDIIESTAYSGGSALVSSISSETLLYTNTNPTSGSHTYKLIFECHDLIKKGARLSLSSSIKETLVGVNAKNSLSLKLTDWEGTLKSDLVGSSPDLTGSKVNIYMSVDSITDFDDYVQIFAGKISNWKTSNDVMTIQVKNINLMSGSYPGNLLKDLNPLTLAGENITKPLQYGDFGNAVNFRNYDDFSKIKYAQCPLHKVQGSNDNMIFTYWVASHEMNTFPSSTDFKDQDSCKLLIYRDGLWMELNFDPSSTPIKTVSNTSAGCYIELQIDSTYDEIVPYVNKYATSADSYNTVPLWHRCCDGKAATSCSIIKSRDTLEIKDFEFNEIKTDFNYNSSNFFNIHFRIELGTVTNTGSGGYEVWVKTTVWDSYTKLKTFYSADSNSWIEMTSAINFSSTYDMAVNVKILHNGEQTSFAEIKNVVARLGATPLSDQDKYVYIPCKGREFSGTWDARKTAGNLIEKPVDMIESIFRDEFGLTNLDTDAFDALNSAITFYGLAASIFRQKKWNDLLAEFAEAFIFGIVNNIKGEWSIYQPSATNSKYKISGTSTPGAQDIFNDVEVLTNNIFTNHPYQRKTFALSRSADANNYDKIIIQYTFVDEEEYLHTKESTTSGKELIIKNPFVDATSLIYALNAAESAYIGQRMIVDFSTFFNAIDYDLGDVINIRHSALDDDLLDTTINTQKWQILAMKTSFRPAIISIKAIELL